MMSWIAARNEKKLCYIGKINEVIYREWDGDKVTSKLLKYLFQDYVNF